MAQHPLWDDIWRRQFGKWHLIQYFHSATTDNNSFRSECYFDVAEQCPRVHFTIHHESCFTSGLDDQFSRTGRGQRAEHSHQSHLRHTAVLSVDRLKLEMPLSGLPLGIPRAWQQPSIGLAIRCCNLSVTRFLAIASNKK